MERKYWNEEIETMPPRELHELESGKLTSQIRYVYENSSFYRDAFSRAGVSPEDIKRREDLAKLPFLTRDDLLDTQEKEGGLGGHQCAPFSSIVRIQGTSGTTRRSLYVGLTARDAANWKELFARHAWTGGLRPGDSMIDPADFSLSVGGLSEAVAAEAMGICVIPAPLATTGMEKMMQLVRDFRPTILFITPSATVFLADYLRNQAGIDPRELGFKKGYMAGEALTEEGRARIEEEFGLVARSFYGLADVAPDLASECGEAQGMHFCGQGMVAAELVDPGTLEPVEMADGAEGEIIFTTIDREATPVVRYRCRDFVRVFTSSCPCGRTSFRFTVLGRCDEMIRVRGVGVFPSAVKDVICSFVPEVTGEFRIVLRGPGPVIDTALELKVEYGESFLEERVDELARRLGKAVEEKLALAPVLSMVPPYTLQRSEYKMDYFEHSYEAD